MEHCRAIGIGRVSQTAGRAGESFTSPEEISRKVSHGYVGGLKFEGVNVGGATVPAQDGT